MKKRPYKRRTIIIKRGIQFKYTLIVFFAVVLTALTLAISMAIVRGNIIEYLINNPKLSTLLSYIDRLMLTQTIILAVIAIGVGLIISNKILID